jgi:hypothetical protein
MGPALKGAAGVRAPGRLSAANALVVAQVAVSLILLIGAGLFLRSLHNLTSVDAGFNPERQVVLSITLALSSQAARQSFFDNLVERARQMPGVLSASLTNVSPLSGDFSIGGMGVPGQRPSERTSTSINWVGPDFFKTFGTPLLAGRVFTEQDGRANKVIVNERTASHFLAPREPDRQTRQRQSN